VEERPARFGELVQIDTRQPRPERRVRALDEHLPVQWPQGEAVARADQVESAPHEQRAHGVA
jgi:hypothetical protein